jgi:hypothetical protein
MIVRSNYLPKVPPSNTIKSEQQHMMKDISFGGNGNATGGTNTFGSTITITE